MKRRKDFSQECELFSGKRPEDVITIIFKANCLLRSTNLECRDEMLDYLDLVSKTDSNKAVVMMNQFEDSYRH